MGTELGRIASLLAGAEIMIRAAGTSVIKITDFGLAREVDTDTQLTISGAVMGTPAYMSPEQARGKAVDKRADIWAFGCVLYEMLTGRRAFPDAGARPSRWR